MRILTTLKFPKALDLLYYDNLIAIHDELIGRLNQYKTIINQPKNLSIEPMTPIRAPNKKRNNELNLQKNKIELFWAREKACELVEAKVLRDLRELFETNGARNLHNLPCIAPIPTEKTIFLSKAIRLEPWLKKMNYDPSDQN